MRHTDRMLRCLAMSAWVLTAAAAALATTYSRVELTCPVCGTKCGGVSIGSTNTIGGQDRDFLARARGAQPLVLIPSTCPKCTFSGRPADFKGPLDEALKAKILGGKALVVPDWAALSSGKPRAMPAWARHDLIGQVEKLKGAGDFELAHQHMQTAWTVRLEDRPFGALIGALPEPDREWLESTTKEMRGPRKQRTNPSIEEIREAEALLKGLPGYPQARRRAAAIMAGSLLRSRGEHDRLLAAMPTIKTHLSEQEGAQLAKKVAASIALERTYQPKALILFQKVLSTPKKSAKKSRPAVFAYLCGELCRRLGRTDEAIAYFDKAAKMEGAPEFLVTYCKEQRDRATKDAAAKSGGSKKKAK